MEKSQEASVATTDISQNPEHRRHCQWCALKYGTSKLVEKIVQNFYFNLDNSQEKIEITKSHHLSLKWYELSLFWDKARLDNIFWWHEIYKKHQANDDTFWSRTFHRNASIEVEEAINKDVKNLKWDHVCSIEVDNWTALKLYLERRINVNNINSAKVDFYTREIKIHPVFFKSVNWIFPYTLIVKPSKIKDEPWNSVSIRTLDKNWNILK